MPRRIRTKTVGGSVGIRFPKQVSGFPSQEQRLALGITSSALVYAGKEIIGTVSNTSVLELTARDSAMLLGAGITNVNGSLAENNDNKAAETIERVKSAVLAAFQGGDNIGADQEMLDIVLLKFLQPFLEDPLCIGTEAQFQAAYEYFKGVIDSNADVSTFFPIARDALSAVKSGRSLYMDAQVSEKQLEDIKGRYDQALCEIHRLRKKLCDATGVPEGAMGGTLSIVVKQPKPLTYAQAILNPQAAWYQYMYGTGPRDPKLFASLVDYLRKYTSRAEMIAAIHALLDEKYRTFEKDIASTSTAGTRGPCTSGSKDSSSGNKNSCTASSTGQGETTSCTNSSSYNSTSDSCSSHYDSDACDKCITYGLIPGHQLPFEGGSITVLSGRADIATASIGGIGKPCRPKCGHSRRRHKRRHRKRTVRHGLPVGSKMPLGDGEALVLGGKLHASTICPSYAPKKDCSRRKDQCRRRHRSQRKKECSKEQPFKTRKSCGWTSSSSSEDECRHKTRKRVPKTRLPFGWIDNMLVLPGKMQLRTTKTLTHECVN